MARFVRFVVLQKDESSGTEQGFIQALETLSSEGQLTDYEEELAQETFRWFNDNLPVPDSFTRSRRPGAPGKAISWFKSSAKECIARMENVASVLNEHGYHTRRLTTDRPGYVVYEDAYQIVAEVFRSDTTSYSR
jgi:hypothetical protein